MNAAAARARSVLSQLEHNLPAIVDLYRDLHAHPELSGHEQRTAAIVADWLRDTGLEVSSGVGGHGVVGLLANGPGPVVALRADMDALPIAEETGLAYASTTVVDHAGGTRTPVMHACGHDLHTASLIGAAQCLATHTTAWSGTLFLIAQPAEESFQGAKAMLADGLFTKFPRPDVVLGQHCAATRAGMVHHRVGPMYSACRNFRITIHGKGAHGAAPNLSVDPVVLAAQAVMMLQTIVAREVEPDEMSVVTVGSIHAGTRPNIIPGHAVLEVTLRAHTEALVDQQQDAMERIVRGVCAAGRAPREPDIELLEQTFPVINDAEVTARVREAHAALFPDGDVSEFPWTSKGSEDFACYGLPGPSRYNGPAIPVSMWLLGSTAADVWDATEGMSLRDRIGRMPGHHTAYFAPDPLPTLRRGIETLVAAALAFLPQPAAQPHTSA